MDRERIYITETDLDKLRRLIAGRRGAKSLDSEYLEILEAELDRAEVVAPDEMPRHVVTMHSEVRLKALDTGEVRTYKLVFPSEPRTEGSISVLAPIGTAMLGYHVGSVIEWRVPKGIRRFKVLKVVYQPEAAGVAGD